MNKVKDLLLPENFDFKEFISPEYTLKEQLIIAFCFSAIWFSFINGLKPLIAYIIKDHKWFNKILEQDWENMSKEDKEELPKEMTKEEFKDAYRDGWAEENLVMFQHFVGGLLCIPAVFGLFEDKRFASALACLGCLSETGWEFYDTVKLINEKFFTENGHEEVPRNHFWFVMLHHSAGMGLVIPLNLYYPNEYYYHIFGFNYQCTLYVIYFCGEYQQTLDIEKKGHLLQFNILTIIIVIFWSWTRIFHFFIAAYYLLNKIEEDNITWDGFEWLESLAWGIIIWFSFFNYHVTKGMVSKMIKFLFHKGSMEEKKELKNQLVKQLTRELQLDHHSAALKRWAKLRAAVKIAAILKSNKNKKDN